MRCIIFCHSENSSVDVRFLENDYFVAADSGYLYAKRCGIDINVLIGDFDSIPMEILDTILPENRITLPTHKNETDTHYAVQWAMEKGFEEIIICGGLTGERVSHTFANIATLKFIADNGKIGQITDGNITARVVNEGSVILTTSICDIKQHLMPFISVFPLVPDTVVTLRSLAYPLFNYPLSLNSPLGVSNEPLKDVEGEIIAVKGQILVIVENK